MQQNIVILGGGTAGWIMAARLAAEQLSIADKTVTITLVESSAIPTIGVGEGSWPSMRDTLAKIGIPEKEFLHVCQASFKQGSRFINWRFDPNKNENKSDSYDHPFTVPPLIGRAALGKAFQKTMPSCSFAHWVCLQPYVFDGQRAPKQLHTPDYAGVLNYGYHLDAGKFAQLLKKYAVDKFGVKHIIGHFESAEFTDAGLLSALVLTSGEKIAGDFFIDASGTHNQLIGGVLASDFISLSESSPNDRALAIAVPYPEENSAIACPTISTAQEAGWIWDVGLQHRRGIGYVYASQFSSDEQAKAILANYVQAINPRVDINTARQLTIRPGYRAKPWVANCVAVGMAAGFIEPLEASALVMVELAATFLCENLPATEAALVGIAERYNQLFVERWGRIRDFLQLHYLLSDRRDTPYWRYVTETMPITDRLEYLLKEWRYRDPNLSDFGHYMELFPPASYQYVLMGMQPNYITEDFNRATEKNAELLTQIDALVMKREHYLTHLPTNRAYFNALQEAQLMVN